MTPRSQVSFAALDFETASASQRASACSAGLVVVRDGDIALEKGWLIDPDLDDSEWSPYNTFVHGLRPEDVKGAPSFELVWQEIASITAGLPFVAHNASFDMSVVRSEGMRAVMALSPFRYACSVQIARYTWPELGSYSLPNLASTFGLPLDHHNAVSDARASALIVVRATDVWGVDSLDGLLDSVGLRWGEVSDWELWAPPSGRRRTQIEGVAPDPNHLFFGQIVVFTGSLGSMPRYVAKAYVEARGGHPRSTVTKKTRFVVVGGLREARLDLPGVPLTSKHEKALQLAADGHDVVLLGEGEFLALI